VLGEEPVEAMAMHQLGPTGIDLACAGQLRFPRERVLQFDSGFRAHFRASVEIVGTDGVLLVANPYKPAAREHLVVRHGDETRTIDVEGDATYAGELEDMADAVLLGRPPRISLAESRGNLVALLALEVSARSGRVERV
jgi:D-xylose 1-dehydrogenase (NADP+, D-xylono-1,5-lactone-forming)